MLVMDEFGGALSVFPLIFLEPIFKTCFFAAGILAIDIMTPF